MRARNILAGLIVTAAATGALAQDKVVYHINDTAAQALGGLRNIGNHLDVDPTAQITVVTHSPAGIEFMMLDKKDKNGNPWEVLVQTLAQRGVKFEVCEITLRNAKLDKKQFLAEAQFTPSGVVRLAKLQKEGYSYIKP